MVLLVAKAETAAQESMLEVQELKLFGSVIVKKPHVVILSTAHTITRHLETQAVTRRACGIW